MDYIKTVFKQFSAVFLSLPANKRIFATITVLITIASFAALIIWTSRVEYKSLYTGLSAEDSGAVINRLKEMKVIYRIGRDGNSIMVPASSVYEIRMQMARDGLPQNTGVGYEIFDEQSIGATEFIQKINFQRAVQGELVRTINQFSSIKSSRVHLVLPKKTLFSDDQQKPRASVVLNLYPGRRLTDSQINGIMHLIASSVEGLSNEDVIIVDTHGKLLAGGEKKSELSGFSFSQQELQETTERKLENKIENMLAEIVGPESVTAKVSVSMNFTRVEETAENFDPDKVAVRSEQRSTEKSSGKRSAASGVPGVISNTPDVKNNASGSYPSKSSDYNKADETINYEISHVVKKTISPVGEIEKLSVAVMVDGTYTTARDKDGNNVRKYVPRLDEDIQKYKTLVMKAVGYDKDRGDSIEVVNFQFRESLQEEASMADSLVEKIDWQSMISYMITAVLFALFFVFGLKPLLNMLSKSVGEVEEKRKLIEGKKQLEADSDDELPPGMQADGTAKAGTKESQLINFAETNPKLFSQYIKGWIE